MFYDKYNIKLKGFFTFQEDLVTLGGPPPPPGSRHHHKMGPGGGPMHPGGGPHHPGSMPPGASGPGGGSSGSSSGAAGKKGGDRKSARARTVLSEKQVKVNSQKKYKQQLAIFEFSSFFSQSTKQ